MPTNSELQERLLDALEALNTSATAQELRLGADSFTVTYHFAAYDLGSGDDEVFESPQGYRGTVTQFSLYNLSEAIADGAGTIAVGLSGGDVDAYVDETVIAISAINLGVVYDNLTAGVTGTIPSSQMCVVTGTAPGGAATGIFDLDVTVRYFL